MSGLFDAFKNPDGRTFNGAAMLAELTGLSQAEVTWTAGRLRRLMLDEGKTREEAVAIVKAEAAGRPWEVTR